MKKIFKYSFLLMAVCLAFVSCKEEDDYTAGTWNANADYADVYFPVLSNTVELDPTDDTQFEIELVRRNTVGALSVNLDVLKNDDNVFEVGSADFADGDSLAKVTVKFPNAEIGTAYQLQLSTTNPKYVSQYSEGIIYNATVTRVKWNYLGMATFVEGFWYELTDECELYQRDDVPSQFRMKDPFKLATAAELTDGNESEYITFRILKPTEKLFDVNVADMKDEDDLVYFNPINTGYFHPSYSADVMMYHPSHFSSLNDWTCNHVVRYQENGLPGLINLAPYYYMIGVGGWNNTQTEGIVQIYFPGYTEPHVADITSDDFEWEALFSGSFTSEKLGAGEATLYKGTCVNTQDDCDKIFAETYGTAYRIAEPYAEGYDIFFAVDKNGKIVVPDGFRLQPTGLDDNMGHNIFAKIDQTTSSFSETEVILTISFVNEDETLDYGASEESLANISWTPVGTGTYTYVAWEADEAEPDPGYILSKRDDKEDVYRIEEWFFGTNLVFTWDKATNQCHVPEQWCFDHPDYGGVYVCDGPTYHSALADQPVLFDPTTNTFKFYLVYYCEAGIFARDVDTFQVEFNESSVKAVTHAKNFKPAMTITMPWHRQSKWQAKKVQKQSPKASITSTETTLR